MAIQLDTKQKIMIPLIILAGAILSWQVYKVFKNDTPAPMHSEQFKKPETQVISKPEQAPTPSVEPATGGSFSQPTSRSTYNQNAATNSDLKEKYVANEIKQYQQKENATPAETKEYLRLVNQLHLLKMQRMVVEEYAAIAQAEAKRSQAMENLRKDQRSLETKSITPSSLEQQSQDYKLAYIEKRDGQWSATLRMQNRFIEVVPKITLPDGTRVESISKDGVVLEQNGKTTILHFPKKAFKESAPQPKARPAKSKPAPISKPVHISKPKPIHVGNKATKALPAAPSTSVTSATAPKVAHQANNDIQSIQSLNPNAFTLQLLNSSSESNIANFIKKNNLKGKAVYYPTKSQAGKISFNLIYGVFPNKEQASAALYKLPASIVKWKPQIRAINTVQKELGDAQGSASNIN